MTEALWRAGIPVHYAVNNTGHGWRKLLRHPGRYTYRVHTVPPVPPVLDFIAREAGHDAAEAYGTLNMGAGFALFVPVARAAAAVAVAAGCGVAAWVAGVVETGPKRLVVEPLALQFEADSLTLR